MARHRIATKLALLAERIRHTPELQEDIERILDGSVIPALEHLLNDRIDYFGVMALGEDVTIQDWSATRNAPFYEVGGRLRRWGDRMGQLGERQDHGDIDCDSCPDCDDANVKSRPPWLN